MANPILSRSDAFTCRAAHPQPGYGVPGYGMSVPQATAPSVEPAMTLDDVISRTGLVMGVLMASAVVSFTLLDLALYMPVLVVSSIVGFVTVLFVSARRKVNPALVLAYAAVEGVFIGALTRMFEYVYPGIAAQAVLGTFAAATVTLGAYRFAGVRVGSRGRRMVFITTLAFAGVMLVNMLLSFAGIDTGLRGGGVLGLVAALLGAGLAVFNLLIDFDDIGRGIAGQAPRSESWRAAFGLAVTMVWLYTEVLRISSYVRR